MDIPGVLTALQRRARTSGGEPLLTHYDLDAGGRTELSVATFANWVAKTANLIEDLGADSGLVALPLALSRPGHWMTLLWPLAAWQRECAITLDAAGADLAVVGPDDPRPVLPGATLACSLHPLGLGLRDLPDGVLDFTGEALTQPDQSGTLPSAPSAPAWIDGSVVLSHADLAATTPVAGRVLVRPSGALETLRSAILGPLLGGGSSVVVEGTPDDALLAKIRASEHCME
ncbi:TIGR03089 family protein [Micropruina sp.]|uniref:TIGR03089 family protein n=1 Tax=Micropruina sp. TaxID=2737536 RepID=UPI00261C4359|nr:TIGR03089 family protein [Micropruina sp.]